jgi:uncharacterized protein (DUF433 family)
MSSMISGYDHILVGEDGVAIIAAARMKVAQLIAEVMAYGWSPEELHFQHPQFCRLDRSGDVLTMSQIHSALAYYWDHLEEIEQQVDADLRLRRKMRGRAGDSPLVARLKAEGLR